MREKKFANWLWEQRAEAGMTQQEVAEAVGISARSYQAYERGEQDVPRGKRLLLEKFYIRHGEAAPHTPEPINGENPVYSLEVARGGGNHMIDTQVVGHVQSPISKSFWLRAVGDSMEPTIPENAAIQVLPYRGSIQNILTDGIYCFRLHHGFHVKRLQLLPGRRVRVISDNSRYPAFEVDIDEVDDFEVLGRVQL